MQTTRLDMVLHKERRTKIVEGLFVLLLLSGSASGVAFALKFYEIAMRGAGAVLIVWGALFSFLLAEFYYRSHRGAELFAEYKEKRYQASGEALRWFFYGRVFSGRPIVFRSLWQSFANIDCLEVILVRLGIGGESFVAMMNAGRGVEEAHPDQFQKAILDAASARNSDMISVADILEALYGFDKAFAKFLFDARVKKEHLLGAALWVEGMVENENERMQWWARKNLARLPALGKDFGFGYTYILDQYARDLAVHTALLEREARRNEIERIEQVLARSYEANIVLVGEDGAGKHVVLEGLASWIRDGRAVSALENRRVVLLDGARIVAAAKTKGAYEELLIKILNDTVRAGNIVLVIENFAALIASSSALGTDIIEIMRPYIQSARMQLIALSNPAAFHREIEPQSSIMKLFEVVELEEPGHERAVRMLEDAASIIETRSGKLFTYQALDRAAELAERFITEGAMPEKGIDLLDESASVAVSPLIMPEDIEVLVEKRTRIPVAGANEEEKKKLLHMEELLHMRMINQNHAIKTISDALRRVRSGLKGAGRPAGSFLLLGPTGVGKTQTAKALAEMYFGGAEAMIRFDMSEYHGEDGLKKLIGAYDSKEPGILSSRLRERPFSLLVFDEFEKASREVHNIFLQILDEGFFSDGAGKRVSARETMIIATSNAGANQIVELLKAGSDPADIQNTVVDSIRADGVFLPELLNRFDAIVVYHPLSPKQLEQVAMLMLNELKLKLEVNEMHFEPSQELARRVVDIGYDPVFGARPMRRVIADRVEQVIAKKILEGSLKRGDSFAFSKEDIAAL